MWWGLPIEIVDEILKFISFEDYVALTQTSNELRRVLDNIHHYNLVLKANIGDELNAYEEDFWFTKSVLWKSLGELRRFLKLVDSIYPANTLEPFAEPEIGKKRDQVIHTAINLFIIHHRYMAPILLELKLAEVELEQNSAEALNHPKIFSVSRISWLRKLLQLHGFVRTVEFAISDESDNQSDFCLIETCYFELSRCHIDFAELAKYREITLSKIRKDIRACLPISAGILKFNTKTSYHKFLAKIIKIVIGHLKPKNYKPGFAGNTLRIYKGLGGETIVPYLAIVAKILDEEIFTMFSFNFAGEICGDPDRFITPLFLVLGKDYVLIDLGSGACQFYDEEDLAHFPDSIRPHLTEEITVDTVIQRAFDSEEGRVPGTLDFLKLDWNNMHNCTSMIKLRFLRTLLLGIRDSNPLNENDFRPLIHNSDFFLFFHTARKVLADHEARYLLDSDFPEVVPLEIPSFHDTTEHFSCVLTAQHDRETITYGDIIVHPNAEYFAVVLGPEPQSINGEQFISTLLFDNIEACSSLYLSLSNLKAANFGESFPQFIKWLMSTDGLIHAGMFLFRDLQVTSDKLTLLPKEPLAPMH